MGLGMAKDQEEKKCGPCLLRVRQCVSNLGQLNKILPVLTYLLKLHFNSFLYNIIIISNFTGRGRGFLLTTQSQTQTQ